jgi:hypothetical protein
MKWKHYIKPDISLCPKEFCIFWNNKGDLFSHGVYGDLDEAFRNGIVVSDCSCSCNFGKCIRDINGGDNDLFEPVEPLHEKCLLPNFYFCDYNKLDEDSKEKYNYYFSLNRFKRVIVKLKLNEDFYRRSKGHLKNSIISSVAVFNMQQKLNTSELWSVVTEIHNEANEDMELICSMRFLVEGAPDNYLDVGSKFIIRNTKILADGIVVGEET